MTDDPRSGSLDLLWSSETGEKSLAAIRDLEELLIGIGQDGQVEDAEVEALSAWLIKHRGVAGRAALKPFKEWLTKVLADGVVDSSERLDLLAWCHWAKVRREKSTAQAIAEAEAAARARQEEASRPWGTEPATGRQLSFLAHLGHPHDRTKDLTKAEASSLIDSSLNEQKKTASGCVVLLLVSALLSASAIAWCAT